METKISKTKIEKRLNENKEIIIDATNAVIGRFASYVAKQALAGKSIIILNSENAIITGNKDSILEHYLQRRRRHGASQKGPIFPSVAEKILKRTIRGMLPHKQERGRIALKNVMCYKGVPEKYKDAKKIEFKPGKTGKNIKLGDLALMLKGRWTK